MDILDRLAQRLNAPVSQLESRVERLAADHRALQKEVERLKSKLAVSQFDSLMAQSQDVAGVRVLAAQVDGVAVDGLRELADRFRDNTPSGVVVLAAVQKGKPVMIAAVTKDLVRRGVKAGDIVREAAKVVGGGGGGRPDMAQAGGKDAGKLPEALAIVPGLVEKALGA